MRSFLILVALLPSLSFAGQLYVCTDGAGKKSFQEMPCSGAVASEVREYGGVKSGSLMASGGWSFYKEDEFMVSDSFCAIRSKEIDVPSDYGTAAVSFVIYKANDAYSVALISIKKGRGNPDVFDAKHAPSVMLGDSGPWFFSKIDGGVSHLGLDDSAKFVEFFLGGGGSVRLKLRLWPSSVERRLSSNLSGYSNMLRPLDDC